VSGLKASGEKTGTKETEWAVLVAKLVSDGRTYKDVSEFTLKQAEYALKEQAEKFKNQARLQGCTFKDDGESDTDGLPVLEGGGSWFGNE